MNTVTDQVPASPGSVRSENEWKTVWSAGRAASRHARATPFLEAPTPTLFQFLQCSPPMCSGLAHCDGTRFRFKSLLRLEPLRRGDLAHARRALFARDRKNRIRMIGPNEHHDDNRQINVHGCSSFPGSSCHCGGKKSRAARQAKPNRRGLVANYRRPWSVEAVCSATLSLMIPSDRKSQNSALKRATLYK